MKRNWWQHKIIYDIMMKLDTPFSLRPQENADLAWFQRIQTLAVDFEIFAALPLKFFIAFFDWERLIIPLYLFDSSYEQAGISKNSGIELRTLPKVAGIQSV